MPPIAPWPPDAHRVKDIPREVAGKGVQIFNTPSASPCDRPKTGMLAVKISHVHFGKQIKIYWARAKDHVL